MKPTDNNISNIFLNLFYIRAFIFIFRIARNYRMIIIFALKVAVINDSFIARSYIMFITKPNSHSCKIVNQSTHFASYLS
jgi:hypothetical protein